MKYFSRSVQTLSTLLASLVRLSGIDFAATERTGARVIIQPTQSDVGRIGCPSLADTLTQGDTKMKRLSLVLVKVVVLTTLSGSLAGRVFAQPHLTEAELTTNTLGAKFTEKPDDDRIVEEIFNQLLKTKTGSAKQTSSSVTSKPNTPKPDTPRATQARSKTRRRRFGRGLTPANRRRLKIGISIGIGIGLGGGHSHGGGHGPG